MRLHMSEDTGDALSCPTCDRELWPAYWTEDRLKVGYWVEFAPPDGQEGLLVCGNFECTYEEPVTFVQSPADAVTWNYEWTYMEFYDQSWLGFPQAWLLEHIEYLEHLQAQTGQPKLQCGLALCRQEFEERGQEIERWLVEAAKGYPVTFHAAEETLKGQILGSHDELLILQTPEGEVQVVPKNLVWQLRIEYPRKERKPAKRPSRDGQLRFPLSDPRYMVVDGYHLRYGEPTEMGGFYRGRCWDPVVAAALKLREEQPGYWEGAFRAEEIERFYSRNDYVKIKGYWLQELSRNKEPRLVSVRTEDPEVAEALDMEPQYAREANEFGGWDGDVFAYRGYFSIDEIEETRWAEEPLSWPPDNR
jgi:hypothetical protein